MTVTILVGDALDRLRELPSDSVHSPNIGRQTAGWKIACKCADILQYTPATVLDPFAGSGTTGLVADRHRRHAILIEISHEYAKLAESRIRGDSPMFVDVRVME